MKQFLLISIFCLSLTACETIESITQDFSSLNPFSAVKTVDVNNDTPQLPITKHVVNQTALQTELDEMTKLTGNSPRFDKNIEPVIEPLDEELITEAITTQPAIETIDPIKTALPKVKPDVTRQVVKETINPSVPLQIVEPVKIIEEQKTITENISPAPAVITKPIAIKTAKIINPIITNEEPIFTDADLKLTSATGCPKIQIMPSARSITYFEENMSGQVTARASIDEIRGGCEITSNGMEIDLDILMNGRITNKGRFEGQVNEEAFMTFPYFVSVTTPQGLPIDKKIMATAMRFNPSINRLDHAEKITQYIPMENVNQAVNYKITVGFQLTRKQLEYNRAQSLLRANNVRVSPDLINRPRLSIDPLAK